MRNIPTLYLVPLFIILANPASAQTAAEMMSYCQPLVNALNKGNERMAMEHDQYTFDSGICWGAFRSIQALSAIVFNDETGAWRKKPVLEFCPPPTSSITQFVRVFDNFAKQHPERQHENYEIVAIDALQYAFPCR